jgi:tRNA-dihydrouridine synthase
VSIPLVANGDAQSAEDARAMLAASGADAVMIGRGAYGRPWWPGVIAEGLDPGTGIRVPSLVEEARLVAAHHLAIMDFHGPHHGNRIARKHIGWVISRLTERGLLNAEADKTWRACLLQTQDNSVVALGLNDLYETALRAGDATQCR